MRLPSGDHAAVETPTPTCARRITQCKDLGVRGRVVELLAFIVASREDLPVVESCNDGADRHVVVLECRSRFVERDAHEVVESFGHDVAASAARSTRSTVPRSMQLLAPTSTSSPISTEPSELIRR